jgi:hypothetical protein
MRHWLLWGRGENRGGAGGSRVNVTVSRVRKAWSNGVLQTDTADQFNTLVVKDAASTQEFNTLNVAPSSSSSMQDLVNRIQARGAATAEEVQEFQNQILLNTLSISARPTKMLCNSATARGASKFESNLFGGATINAVFVGEEPISYAEVIKDDQVVGKMTFRWNRLPESWNLVSRDVIFEQNGGKFQETINVTRTGDQTPIWYWYSTPGACNVSVASTKTNSEPKSFKPFEIEPNEHLLAMRGHGPSCNDANPFELTANFQEQCSSDPQGEFYRTMGVIESRIEQAALQYEQGAALALITATACVAGIIIIASPAIVAAAPALAAFIGANASVTGLSVTGVATTTAAAVMLYYSVQAKKLALRDQRENIAAAKAKLERCSHIDPGERDRGLIWASWDNAAQRRFSDIPFGTNDVPQGYESCHWETQTSSITASLGGTYLNFQNQFANGPDGITLPPGTTAVRVTYRIMVCN